MQGRRFLRVVVLILAVFSSPDGSHAGAAIDLPKVRILGVDSELDLA